jgi:hypothetical protein
MGFAEFTIGPAKGRTRWLNPPYRSAHVQFRTAGVSTGSPVPRHAT